MRMPRAVPKISFVALDFYMPMCRICGGGRKDATEDGGIRIGDSLVRDAASLTILDVVSTVGQIERVRVLPLAEDYLAPLGG